MKGFWKAVLAVICGLLITRLIVLFLGLGMLGSIGSGKPTLPKEGVLVMDFSKLTLTEQTTPNTMPRLGASAAGVNASTGTSIGIHNAAQALKIAAEDPAVKFIYLKCDMLMSDGYARIQELRAALQEFRSSGKAVVAWTDAPGTLGYYLASVSDKIYMSSAKGMTNMFTGISTQLVFIKDLLDRLGVNVYLIRHGKYKSAGEMFVRNSASEDNLEQNRSMVSSIWESLAAQIAESRGISVESLDACLNELKLNDAEDFLREGLVDELMTREELKEKMATLYVVDKFKDVKFIPFADYMQVKLAAQIPARRKIAVVYADGEIVDGAAKQQVAGDRFCEILASVRADSTVKGVVLRVNSPGGSVMASDKIREEIRLTSKVKPVAASYSNYAASGGYWISAGCDKIFTMPSTLTGSIGVFSLLPEFSKTLKKVAGVNITSVGSHEHADVMSLMRPFTAEETAYLQKSVEDIYGSFVNVVCEGRGLEPDYVDSIAQGRVWTGTQGLEIGLVDEIGTLEDAIRYVANTADEGSDPSSWKIEQLPAPPTTMETLMEALGTKSALGTGLALAFRPTHTGSHPGALQNTLAGTPYQAFGESILLWASHAGKALTPQPTTLARLPWCMTIQ